MQSAREQDHFNQNVLNFHAIFPKLIFATRAIRLHIVITESIRKGLYVSSKTSFNLEGEVFKPVGCKEIPYLNQTIDSYLDLKGLCDVM